MNKCLIQFWEESERGWGVRPDGCSIHLDKISHSQYVDSVYGDRSNTMIPDEYDRVSGSPFECFVSNDIFEKVKLTGSIRLWENEKNNLVKMGDLIFKPEI